MPLMHPFMPMTDRPFTPNVTDIPDELREKALKRTTEMMRKFVEMQRSLELSINDLPIVIEIYGQVVTALIAEKEREELDKRTQRLPMTMRSETSDYCPMKIKPGSTYEVIVRPQTCVFRPEDLAIHGDRSRWVVHDIKVGNRSQFAGKRGPAPGTEFGPGGILEHLRLETCQTAMNLVFVIEYVGPEAEGEVFEGTIVGTAVAF